MKYMQFSVLQNAGSMVIYGTYLIMDSLIRESGKDYIFFNLGLICVFGLIAVNVFRAEFLQQQTSTGARRKMACIDGIPVVNQNNNGRQQMLR
jgi:hypothetical protein